MNRRLTVISLMLVLLASSLSVNSIVAQEVADDRLLEIYQEYESIASSQGVEAADQYVLSLPESEQSAFIAAIGQVTYSETTTITEDSPNTQQG